MKKPFTKLLLDQPHNVILKQHNVILKHLKTRAKDVAKQGNLFISRMPVVPYKSIQDAIRGKNDSMS